MLYYPFHIGDYSQDTAHLSLMEDLAYRRLIDLCYRTEQPLSSDIRQVCRLIRMQDHEQAVETVLREFFSLDETGWTHARCQAEINRYHARQQQAHNAGKASAERRSNASSTTVERPLNDSSTNHKPTTINQQPTTNNQQIQTPSRKRAVCDDPAFDEAWSEYPKRPGASRAEALRAWTARIKAGASADEMIAGVKRYAEFCRIGRIEPRFIKQPATFFGPDRHYESDWRPDGYRMLNKQEQVEARNDEALEAWLREEGVIDEG